MEKEASDRPTRFLIPFYDIINLGKLDKMTARGNKTEKFNNDFFEGQLVPVAVLRFTCSGLRLFPDLKAFELRV